MVAQTETAQPLYPLGAGESHMDFLQGFREPTGAEDSRFR